LGTAQQATAGLVSECRVPSSSGCDSFVNEKQTSHSTQRKARYGYTFRLGHNALNLTLVIIMVARGMQKSNNKICCDDACAKNLTEEVTKGANGAVQDEVTPSDTGKKGFSNQFYRFVCTRRCQQ
jgi:hypothetical protein